MTPDDITTALRDGLRDIRPGGLDMEALQLLADSADAAVSRLRQLLQDAAGGNSMDAVMMGAVRAMIAADDAMDATRQITETLLAQEKAIKAARDSMGAALNTAMLECGDPGAVTVATETHIYTLHDGRPSVVITDAKQVPAQYWKAAEPTINKAAISAMLKAGQRIPGARLQNGSPYATLNAKKELVRA